MTQDYPTCTQCGGAPKSREEEYCRYCGAPLPWSTHDLRSRRVVVLVSSHSMEEALDRVERSGEFQRASLGLRRRQSSSRKIRLRHRGRGTQFSDDTLEEFIGLLVLIVPIAFFAVVGFAGRGWPQFLIVAAGASALSIWGAQRSSTTQARRWRSANPRRRAVSAAGIVELGPPRPRTRKDTTLVRDVHAKVRRGRNRRWVADVHHDLHAGDVGIAHLRGTRLESFDRLDHVQS